MTKKVPSLAALACLLLLAPSGAATAAQEEEALTYSASWTAEGWANVYGGRTRGTALLGNLDLGLALDGPKAMAWPGLTLLVRALVPHGASPSELLGDVQAVSNIDAAAGLRLFEAWGEQALGPASLRLGLYDLNSEFDAIEAGGLFVHSSHGIGAEFAATGHNGPSIFPVTSLAARLRAVVGPAELLAALLDGVPGDPAAPDLGGLHVSADEGLLLTLQAGWRGEGWRAAAGAWRYTGAFQHLVEARQVSGNGGLYALGEAALPRLPGVPGALCAFLRMGVADQRVSRFDAYLGGGLVWQGLWSGRPEDRIGLAVAVARHGQSFREAAVREGPTVPPLETAFELTWQLPVTGWLTVQPDLQYVVSPGSDARLPSSLAVAVRLVLAFEGGVAVGASSKDPAWQPASARSDQSVARDSADQGDAT